MIPENKLPAVKKALQTAFGVTEFDEIQQLTKGLSSALIFKITIHRNPYLLRLITRTDAMADPTNHFVCMEHAAVAGLAPLVHYLSIEERISITGFIQEQPFPMHEAKEKMAQLLRQLHALPKFPALRNSYFEMMNGFVTKFRAANIFPETITKDLFEAYEHVFSLYPHNDQQDWVSCHNDAKPENIIFDGTRPWFIDWEAAFLNDRYLDLAVVANFVVKHEEDEIFFLEKYFGEIDDYKRARFFIMSQLLHVFYFTFLALIVSDGKPINIDSIVKHNFSDFHDGMWNGKITLKSNETRLQYAWLHMQEFLRKMQLKRFNESLHIISAYK